MYLLLTYWISDVVIHCSEIIKWFFKIEQKNTTLYHLLLDFSLSIFAFPQKLILL